MTAMPNPTGKHRQKRRRHGEGTVVPRAPYRLKDGTLRKRAKPWAAVVPYLDESGRRREMWLSAGSKREADELRKAELARLQKGLVLSDETVAGYVNDWLSTLDVGPGTFPRYKAHVDVRIAPTIGSVPLASLTPQKVRAASSRWSGSAQTRAGTLRLLRAAMRQAVADRRIEHDPTAGIPYPRAKRHEPVTLTAEQAKHLMAVVRGERFAPILAVSLGLGVRRGEALGLRVQDVDLAAGTVTIAKSLRYIPPSMRSEGEDPYRLTGTKTGETRVVPLPAFVADALRERLAERERERKAAKVWAANDAVFCSPSGNTVPLETLYAWFVRALVKAGLPRMRWHDLRASTATLLIEMGVDLETVRRILGHRDIATTLRYIGQTPTALRGAADKLGEAMG
jgi:integrase